ncbi:hypothetical protein [Candidatus Enterococcus lemimoniae]|uniref:Uncharacterized protein n=1 Tax=Candidatus Enterococcus lemimoniae TaxID=1834167 RepID=A0ABZ2T7W6_9ENTE|nr:hypothetical protein [Enterococcus sp. 12C11_DIV0727]OTO68871.1 hypothetical protein A5866_001069 [Enterococcus sp. 12C11_DIV0727]
MSNFGNFNRPVEPSSEGDLFTVDTQVTFLMHGQLQTGIITKQLNNSAVVEIDENSDNTDLIVKSNGVIVINYKKLKKV